MTDRPKLCQFDALKPADFQTHPIWVNCHVIDCEEPWYADTDEETFRPWTEPPPADPHETMFLVAADLVLSDGTRHGGFLTPATDDQPTLGDGDLSITQPHIFLPDTRAFGFWFGIFEPSADRCASLYESLGKQPDQVFPINFAAKQGLAKGLSSGTIPGFCWYQTKREGFLGLRRTRRVANKR